VYAQYRAEHNARTLVSTLRAAGIPAADPSSPAPGGRSQGHSCLALSVRRVGGSPSSASTIRVIRSTLAGGGSICLTAVAVFGFRVTAPDIPKVAPACPELTHREFMGGL